MSDAAPDAVQVEVKERDGFGRNQVIVVGVSCLALSLSFALVIMSKLDASKWLDFATGITTAALGFSAGGSALIKFAQAWRR